MRFATKCICRRFAKSAKARIQRLQEIAGGAAILDGIAPKTDEKHLAAERCQAGECRDSRFIIGQVCPGIMLGIASGSGLPNRKVGNTGPVFRGNRRNSHSFTNPRTNL